MNNRVPGTVFQKLTGLHYKWWYGSTPPLSLFSGELLFVGAFPFLKQRQAGSRYYPISPSHFINVAAEACWRPCLRIMRLFLSFISLLRMAFIFQFYIIICRFWTFLKRPIWDATPITGSYTGGTWATCLRRPTGRAALLPGQSKKNLGVFPKRRAVLWNAIIHKKSKITFYCYIFSFFQALTLNDTQLDLIIYF